MKEMSETDDPMKEKKKSPEEPRREEEKLTIEEQLALKEEEIRSLKDQLDQKEGILDSVISQLKQEVASALNKNAFFERETRQAKERANEDLLVRLLDVYDNFQRALQAMEGTPDSPVKQGVLLIAKQFESLLKQEGVEEIVCLGQPFDCNKHEADCFEETDRCPEGTVTEVLSKGATYKNKILRPARVRVAKCKISENETEEPS
jgi:molecular chaperone GrpE